MELRAGLRSGVQVKELGIEKSRTQKARSMLDRPCTKPLKHPHIKQRFGPCLRFVWLWQEYTWKSPLLFLTPALFQSKFQGGRLSLMSM